MSLIWFHRLLIAFAIVFCFTYAVWELVRGGVLLGVVFLVLGIGLCVYLRNLAKVLKLPPLVAALPPMWPGWLAVSVAAGWPAPVASFRACAKFISRAT